MIYKNNYNINFENYSMLDLRNFDEFNNYRVKGSSHFPLRYLKLNMWSSLPSIKSDPLILIGNPD